MISAQNVPDLSVKHLQAIVALARFGSFIAAASYLQISQPSLSRIIQQAEKRIGVTLFVRGARNVSQTQAGDAFAPVAERLLGELLQQTQNVRALDGEMRGQLIIACLMSVADQVLPTALVEFRKKHSKMHIQIRAGLASAIHEDVRSGIVDFGIGNAVGLHENIAVHAIVDEPCYVILPDDHPLNARTAINLADIETEPMISMPTNSGLRRSIDMAASAQGVVLNHSIIINQFRSLFEFVASGLGLAIVPATVLPPPERYSVIVKPLQPALLRRIGILHLAERSLTPAAEAFLEIFEPKFITATGQQLNVVEKGR
ncbi:MAG: LysR family transcriptional regulator [Alphaproteobacteria bacterium]|nr:LysR family transcriptional regulator [Alphaproteobacteria bacterium]